MANRNQDELRFPHSVSLEGKWTYALDPEANGVSDKWFQKEFTNELQLPGSLDVQGMGDPVTVESEWVGTIFDQSYFEADRYAAYRENGNIKVPFWLQPETRYVGTAWYQREIQLPEGWEGEMCFLFLERPHWRVRVWLDEREVGSSDTLSTEVCVELGELEVGRTYRLTLCVDNRIEIPVGENAHSISDHTQGNWNGIVGRIELLETKNNWIDRVEIFPNVSDRSIRVVGWLSGEFLEKEVALSVRELFGEENCVATTSLTAEGDGWFEVTISLGSEARLWSEFDPALYELETSFAGYRKTEVFGLSEFSVEGTQFCINGSRTFLRGALDCCIFPLTGHPPMEVAEWRRILDTIKNCGFNHVRFHSWCPPEAAFQAGDALGLYFQVECAVWPNSVAVLAFNSPEGIGDRKSVDEWVYQEGERIIRAYGNHPCFVLIACGNEPGGPHHESFLGKWVTHFRKRDSRRLYTGTAGWPEIPENEFQVVSEPRIHQWGDGLGCRLNGAAPSTFHDYQESVAKRTTPLVAHENGQWCAYPNLSDVEKYSGHLKARNFEIFADDLKEKGLWKLADAFVEASGKLQALCYKEEIESALRTPGFGGYQLLGLQDFPGQGTAPIGMLDAFWETKGYIAESEIRRFCGERVVLARLDKRVFMEGETLEAKIEFAHYGSSDLLESSIGWKLVSDESVTVAEGVFPKQTLRSGCLNTIGVLSTDLSGVASPARYHLMVEVKSGELNDENDWDIWVYPIELPKSEPIETSLVSNVSDSILKLESGESVLLVLDSKSVASEVALGFSPIFWNTACTQQQAPHTLGVLCDPEHPAFNAFPTDFHTNWQWWYLLSDASPMRLDLLPSQVEPIVRVIDDWYTNRSLGLIWEARVGRGKLLVCSIDLLGSDLNPVKRQLLFSLLSYVQGGTFEPQASMSPSELEGRFESLGR